AVSRGGREERAVSGQRCTRKVVHRAVNTRNLSAVEEIERFAQNFQLRSFGNLEPSRNAQVNVPNVRLLEVVARQTGKAVCAARTVGATTWRRAGSEPEGRRIDAAADEAGHARTRE